MLSKIKSKNLVQRLESTMNLRPQRKQVSQSIKEEPVEVTGCSTATQNYWSFAYIIICLRKRKVIQWGNLNRWSDGEIKTNLSKLSTVTILGVSPEKLYKYFWKLTPNILKNQIQRKKKTKTYLIFLFFSITQEKFYGLKINSLGMAIFISTAVNWAEYMKPSF